MLHVGVKVSNLFHGALTYRDLFADDRLLIQRCPLLRKRDANFLVGADGALYWCDGIACNTLDDQLFPSHWYLNRLLLGNDLLPKPDFTAADPILVNPQDFAQQLNALARAAPLSSLALGILKISGTLTDIPSGAGQDRFRFRFPTFRFDSDKRTFFALPQFVVEVTRMGLWNRQLRKGSVHIGNVVVAFT